MVSLSGRSEFLASSLFKVGSSSVNQTSLFWSVHGISLQFSRIDVAPLGIGFDRVFMPQFWSTLVSFVSLEFPIHQASWHPTLLHSNHVTNPSNLGLDDGGLYARGLSLIEYLQIGDVVLPPDSQDGVEGSHVEELQFLDMPVIQCPCLTTIEEGGKNHGIVDLQFRIVQVKSTVRISRSKTFVDLFYNVGIIGLFIWFSKISTPAGYIMPNPVYIYT